MVHYTPISAYPNKHELYKLSEHFSKNQYHIYILNEVKAGIHSSNKSLQLGVFKIAIF